MKRPILISIALLASTFLPACSSTETRLGASAQPDASGTLHLSDVEAANALNYYRKDQSALTNVQERLSGAGLKLRDLGDVPKPQAYTDKKGRTQFYEPPMLYAVESAAVLDWEKGKDQTSWVKELVSGFRAWVMGNVTMNAANATRDVSLGNQTVQKAQLVEGTKRTGILAKPTVYDPAAQAVSYPPAR